MTSNLEQSLANQQTLIEKSLSFMDNCGCVIFNTFYELAEKIFPKLNVYMSKKGRGI